MSLIREQPNQTGGLSLPKEQLTAHRQSLALTALTKLAEQFSERPGFGHLVESLVLTLSGQFATPNAFASVRLPGSRDSELKYFGTGKLRSNEMLSRLDLTHEHRDYFLEFSDPQLVERFDMSDNTSRLGFCLSECEIAVLVPLLHSRRLIGIVGLGEKASRKPYETEDMELLGAMVTSLAPFMANAFIFEEMSEMGRWYLEILNGVRQGVLVFDRFNQLIKINRAGHRILRAFKPKLPRPESLNHVPIDWIFSDVSFKGWTERILAARTPRGRERIKGMMANRGSYERIFTLQVTGIKGGSIDGGLILTLDDMTDAVESERRMFDLERFADKGVMASSIAHEMNNFLGLILGGVELAELRLADGDIERASQTLEKVRGHTNKMTRFTSGLMDYGRLDTSKALADMNTSISDVLSFVGVQRKFTGIDIITRLEPELPEFEFDADQVAQLLLNLLSNAADSVRQANPASGEIVITTSMLDGLAMVSVSDNGVGIEPEVKERLFKSHLTTKADGHGYGLVTCSKILNNHKADVVIESEVNEGATFKISFPLSARDDSSLPSQNE